MNELREPVVAKTGVYPPDMPLQPRLDPNGPTMAKALQNQLGLKLDKQLGPWMAL